MELTTAMREEIEDIMQRHMPAQLSGVLRDRLTELEEKEQELETTKKQYSELSVRYDSLETEANDLRRKIQLCEQREASLIAGEDALAQEKQHLKTLILEADIEREREFSAKTWGVMDSLVRNTNYRENVFRNQKSIYDNNGVEGAIETGRNVTKTAD